MNYRPSLVVESVGCFSTIYEVLADAYTVDPWARDEWKTSLFGFRAPHRQTINWERVTIPWLKDGLKSLARIQLSVNARKWPTIETWRRAAAYFCEFIEAQGIKELAPSSVDRPLILDYFASMSSDSARARARVLVQLFYDLRQYEIVPELPDVVYLMRGEAVVKKTRSPRPYPPDVIERIDHLILESEHLYVTERRIMKLLRFGGPRPSEALRLPLNSLRVTAGGKYWIEYHQSKVDEIRKFPILRSLGLELKEQQEMVRAQYGPNAEFMFPSKKYSIPAVSGRGGKTVAISYSGFRKRMCSTFKRHGITKSEMTGERITGGELHRYRHTLATEMINEGWSLYQIQKYLGHVSSTMTQAYAELHDETLDRLYRELMDSAVDKDGNRAIEAGGFDAGVERMREQLAKAALPNGFCDLPESKPCDFRPNPCLECSFFRTTPVFLDTHRRHRDELKLIVDEGERRGQARVVELNRPTLERVERLIEGLESAQGESVGGGSGH
jgi:integrase